MEIENNSMIPIFPQFEMIARSHKYEIKEVAEKLQFLSDVNFLNLWAWKNFKDTSISLLNDNLIVWNRESDGNFYIFVGGSTNVLETLETIAGFVMQQPKQIRIKIAELSLMNVGERLFLSEDLINAEYVLSIDHVIEIYNKKRLLKQAVRQFYSDASEVRLVCENITPENGEICKDIFRKWCINKKDAKYDSSTFNEFLAFQAFIEMADKRVFVLMLFLGEKAVGFNCTEVVNSTFAISHFLKSSATKTRGVYDILQLEGAKFLKSKHIEYVNIEQDLGSPGLRMAKQKLEPTSFLRKFFVKSDNFAPFERQHAG